MQQTAFNPNSSSNLKPPFYDLCLYVAGGDPKSVRALQNLTGLCEAHLQGHYAIEVINIYQDPERMEADQIFATPTLLKRHPLPKCKLIGDLSNLSKLRGWLDLPEE
jgi:circadian clock protein KaiB